MRFDVVTLFPDILSTLQFGVIGHAIRDKRLSVHAWNPRDYTQDKHGCVDDRPYGGGPGMVLCVQPLRDALQAAQQADKQHKGLVVYLSPTGRLLDQNVAVKLAEQPRLILVAGRYEGIDQRFVDQYVDETLSIGDYVLTGGEIPSLVVIECVGRLLPGVLGKAQSCAEDSFSEGLLDWPHYTRPADCEGHRVPQVLLQGHHKAIECWRLKQSLGLTWQHRPSWLAKRTLNSVEKKLLEEFKSETS